jgi:hypothetical protein
MIRRPRDQFLEMRNFQAEDIARLYRMPQHKIGLMSHATFGNIEHQGIEYVVDALRPWLVRWEQAILTQLVPKEERRRVFAEFLVDGLLRGDTASRYQAYAVARQNGWMSGNDIRVAENMNPVEGLDDYLVPLNMVPAETLQDGMTALAYEYWSLIRAVTIWCVTRSAGSPIKHLGPLPVTLQAGGSDSDFRSQREERSIAGRKRLATAYHRLFAQAAERIVRREKVEVLKLAEAQLRNRNGTSFEDGLTQFYAKHEDFIRREMGPVLLSMPRPSRGRLRDVRASGLSPEWTYSCGLHHRLRRPLDRPRGQILGLTGAAGGSVSWRPFHRMAGDAPGQDRQPRDRAGGECRGAGDLPPGRSRASGVGGVWKRLPLLHGAGRQGGGDHEALRQRR